MSADEANAVFAAFREEVFDDFHLLKRFRATRERDAFVAHVIAVGSERGFAFDEAAVRAVMRQGEQAWLMQGVEVVS